MTAPKKRANDQILPFEASDDLDFEIDVEIDDVTLASLLHPTFDECDDESLLELDDEYWEALLPDDDYEVLPEPGDFWTDQEAA